LPTTLSKTSHQLANVGQADAPDVLESEVEAQQAQLAVTMAEQKPAAGLESARRRRGESAASLDEARRKLEDTPPVNADELVEKIVNESPAVRIAELGVKRAEAALARAKREPIPDLQLRGGMQQNGELLSGPNGRSVGLQGFANVGVRIPIFDRNQGNICNGEGRCRAVQTRGETREIGFAGAGSKRRPDLHVLADRGRPLQKTR